jgi:predicted O-methyltransferase YrrM
MSNLYFDAGPRFDGQKVLLATTSYDSPDASYTFSIARSREALTAAGIGSAYLLLQGNCHVDDARNTVVREFLDSDCTDLVFLDADVSWEPEHLVQLCDYDRDLVGGVYPYRREGEGEQMPVRMIRDVLEPDADGLLEVEGLPTGFMRIRRNVIERMIEDCRWFEKDGRRIPILFDRDIYNGGRRGGDIKFCMTWRDMGGKLYAAMNMRLGHCGKHVLKDSLGASLRRQMGETLKYVAGKLRDKTETDDDIQEAVKYANNLFGAPLHVLKIAVGLARTSTKDVLEIGSGLSTVLVAAACPERRVWAIEHHPAHAQKLRDMVKAAGIKNVVLITAPIKGGWYDLSDDWHVFPGQFGLALVDGPPRAEGKRLKFFEMFGHRVETMLFDDANTDGYLEALTGWAAENGWQIEAEDRSAVLYRR